MCPARGKSANRATEHFGGPTEKEGFRVEAKTDSHDPERTYSLALLPSSEPAAARGGGNQPLHPWLTPGRTDADPTQGPGEDGARWGRRKTPKQEGGWEDGHLLEQASLRTGHPQSQHPYGASSKPASIPGILPPFWKDRWSRSLPRLPSPHPHRLMQSYLSALCGLNLSTKGAV